MVKVNMSRWPLVLIETDGLTTVDAMTEYNLTMDWLLEHAEQQSERFGLIFVSDMDDEQYKSQKREKAAQKLSNTWLKANRERITQQCVAIAMVTKANALMKIMKPIAGTVVRRTMGAPGDVFSTVPEAEAWMSEKLHLAV